jgi:hypothetical protein
MQKSLAWLITFLIFGSTQFAVPPEFDPFWSELVSRKSEESDEAEKLDKEYGPEPGWDERPVGEGLPVEWSETDGSIIVDAYGDGESDGSDGCS